MDWESLVKEQKKHPMSKKSPMYLYATEMVSDYYEKINVKGKTVLTICGSGDQVLNAIFLGARKVVGFDLNKRSKFVALLKIAAIKKLGYREFLSFFGSEKNPPSLEYELYGKFRNDLSPEVRRFFDRIYREYGYEGDKLSESGYFRQRRDAIQKLRKINQYLSDEKSFLELKKKISDKDFIFINSDITKISRKLRKESFDIINLSNVPNYFVSGLLRAGHKDAIPVFASTLVKMKKLLSKKGQIIYYSYSPKMYLDNPIRRNPPLGSSDSTLELLRRKGFSVSQIYFPGTHIRLKDRINVLE